jgi:hypothetical protein
MWWKTRPQRFRRLVAPWFGVAVRDQPSSRLDEPEFQDSTGDTPMQVRTLCKAGLLGILILAALVIGFFGGNRLNMALIEAQDCRTRSRASQLRVALLSYHEEHGAFPPTKYITKQGIVHSWRVLLIPYLHGEGVFAEYDFSKNWDDVANLRVVDAGGFFSSPEADAKEHIATYLSIGPGDVWPWKRPKKSYCVVKGNDRFWLVEDLDSTVHWMEPRF